jgi:hypothetical protein
MELASTRPWGSVQQATAQALRTSASAPDMLRIFPTPANDVAAHIPQARPAIPASRRQRSKTSRWFGWSRCSPLRRNSLAAQPKRKPRASPIGGRSSLQINFSGVLSLLVDMHEACLSPSHAVSASDCLRRYRFVSGASRLPPLCKRCEDASSRCGLPTGLIPSNRD